MKKTLITRLITSFVLFVFIALVLWFSYERIVICLATGLLGAFAVYEIVHATKCDRKEGITVILTGFAVVFPFLPIPENVFSILLAIMLGLAIIISILMMLRLESQLFLKTPFVIAMTMVVVILCNAIPNLRAMEHGLIYLTACIIISVATDSFAYVIGSSLGKHKMTPKISPNKSWEGAIGGLLCATMLAVILGAIVHYASSFKVNFLLLTVYASLASAVGQFGDLAFSAIKRNAGIKDYGTLLPGHGGVLDRFDSWIYALSFACLFCAFGGAFIL